MDSHIRTTGIREIIFGAEDGIVTTLGVVLGVAAAGNASTLIVIVAGLAAMLAEAISMGVGSYLSAKSQRELVEEQMRIERQEMKEKPDEERKEISDIYYKKGFRGKELSSIVKKITSNKKLWLQEMLVWELGIMPKKNEVPSKTATIFFLASLLGIIPILPFLFLSVTSAIPYSVILGFGTLFLTGALKTKLTKRSWLKSGSEMMMLGILAALAGYAIGALLGAPAV
ncbi:MAG: VIT1/CCC1 transporter family protein [Candidatus Aenigmarchaeota archaeon]|nr:VIT1/CCC1 transporter family protein [Candidatus Aenigmarchaeota archaeon]